MVFSRILSGLSPHPSLLCVRVCVFVLSLCPRPPPCRFPCMCVCLSCVFPPSQSFGLLTLQTLSLITGHNKSLRALREEFISLCSSLRPPTPSFFFHSSHLILYFLLGTEEDRRLFSCSLLSLDPSLVISSCFLLLQLFFRYLSVSSSPGFASLRAVFPSS